MKIQSADFAVSVSATDFVAWKGEGDTDYIGNPLLVQVLNLLTIPADPATLYEKYFELPIVDNNDVLFYKSTFNGESIFALNMYRDVYDQLDILTFGIRTKRMRLACVLRSVPSLIQRGIRFATRRMEF